MKNLTKNKTSFFCLTILFLLSICTVPALSQTQTLTEEDKAAHRAEIEEQHQQEQKAFIEGDCETVASFYSEEATRYLNGKPIISQEEAKEFCNKIPRPFSAKGARPRISDNYYVLSENAAYFIRTIDFEPANEDSPAYKREVVTKVWSRTDSGWKIVHFHSSVHSIVDE